MIGQTISHFKVRRLLGSGAMGDVYEAEDTRLDRRVALKVVSAQAGVDHEQLLREAQVAASLNHPSICTVHEVDEDDEGRLFIAMELVDGPTLAEVIAEEGPLPVDRACALLDELARAMSHAHERGVIHRDLKPANIMLTADGDPRIMDFGLAIQHEPGSDLDTDDFGGTLAYVAPEVAHGEEPDEMTDVWALGVIFFEMLTGERPFAGDYTAAILYAVAHTTPTPVGEWNPRAAPLQEPLVDRLLARDRAARLRSMDAVRDALRDLAVAAPPTRRLRLVVAAGAALVAVVLVIVFWPEPAVQPIRGPSVAVLPLVTSVNDTNLQDFARGFSGEVISELAQVSDLRVIAQSSMQRLAGEDLTPAEIADRLGVDTVVGGTVRRVGDNLRISAELLDAQDSSVLWADSFEADPSSALILQASVARAVAVTLKGELTGREERALSTSTQINPRAHRSFVKAMALRESWGPGEEFWPRAVTLLRNTTTLEPEFAPAWAVLSHIYNYQGWYDASPEKNFRGMSRAAAERALELDPGLAAAHLAQANNLYLFEQDFAAADAAFRRALALAPGDANIHYEYAGSYLVMAGRCDEALAHGRQAAELDPLSSWVKTEYALTLINCRRFEDALAYLDEVEPLIAEKHWLWSFRMWSYGHLGRYDEALVAADSARTARVPEPELAVAHWQAGRRDEAWALVGGRPDTGADTFGPDLGLEVAYLFMLEGEHGPVLDALEAMLPDQEVMLMYMLIDPHFDEIREEPRFVALTRAMNMTDF